MKCVMIHLLFDLMHIFPELMFKKNEYFRYSLVKKE